MYMISKTDLHHLNLRQLYLPKNILSVKKPTLNNNCLSCLIILMVKRRYEFQYDIFE